MTKILVEIATVDRVLEALIRSRKSVSGDLDLAGCAYGSNDPDEHRYDDAKQSLVTLDKAIIALREALAEQPAQQEPVAWLSTDSIGERYLCFDKPLDNDPLQPLYSAPPQRQARSADTWVNATTWRGLTIGEIQDLIQFKEHSPFALAEDIEAKLKEKNT